MRKAKEKSPPTRGAWIETNRCRLFLSLQGRPPRGGRGLKQAQASATAEPISVAPHAGGVD